MGLDKKRFRQECKKRIFKRSSRKLDKKVEENLNLLLTHLRIKNILAFVPMAHEPNILKFFMKLRYRYNIFVPFMQGASFKMVKLRLPLQKRAFDIKEPPNSFFKTQIDLAIVPVLGVDGVFRRIGFGKGMYDRFFADLHYRPIVVFLQKQECITSQKVTDGYDVQGDFLITPKKIIVRGDSHVGRDFSRKFCRHHKRRCGIFLIQKDRKR